MSSLNYRCWNMSNKAWDYYAAIEDVPEEKRDLMRRRTNVKGMWEGDIVSTIKRTREYDKILVDCSDNYGSYKVLKDVPGDIITEKTFGVIEYQDELNFFYVTNSSETIEYGNNVVVANIDESPLFYEELKK